MKKDDAVKLIQPIIVGRVLTPAIVNEELQYLVEFTDQSGDIQQRYFTSEQIELMV